MELGADLFTAWNSPQAPATSKKRILLTVIHEIVVDVDEERQELVFRVHWMGGVHVRCAPWVINSEDLQRGEIRAALEVGSRQRSPRHDQRQNVMPFV